VLRMVISILMDMTLIAHTSMETKPSPIHKQQSQRTPRGRAISSMCEAESLRTLTRSLVMRTMVVTGLHPIRNITTTSKMRMWRPAVFPAPATTISSTTNTVPTSNKLSNVFRQLRICQRTKPAFRTTLCLSNDFRFLNVLFTQQFSDLGSLVVIVLGLSHFSTSCLR
jgi:hypothetical protein